MAKKPADARRKLVEFDAQTWQALDLLARDSMKTLQELADEAFRDLLRKYERPTDLKAALRQSARSSARLTEASACESSLGFRSKAAVRKSSAARVRREAAAHAGNQVEGGGAKKHRREPSGRLQRQNSPSGEGCASENGIASCWTGPIPASGP
jgi:hypothetical protein